MSRDSLDPGDVVIIGAPRSGTNMLRDVLTDLPGVTTWPCDEINLIWRHGNRDHPSDELRADQARPEVARFLHKAFERRRRVDGAPVVVEKTCATSLRVEFTRAVLPEAKYLFITRDGIDAAASTLERWHAPFDARYTARKVRYVPPSDLAYYGGRFAATQVRRRRQRQTEPSGQAGSTTWWGPKPDDWRQLLAEHPLDEVAAIQWQRCVESAERGLSGLGADQLLHVPYESFVRDPRAWLDRIMEFLGLSEGDRDAAVAGVSAGSIGKGRGRLGAEATARLEALLGDTLIRHADRGVS